MEVDYVHLDGAQRAKVGLEDILESLTGRDVDLESFTPPLLTVSNCPCAARVPPRGVRRTRDSAFGLRS